MTATIGALIGACIGRSVANMTPAPPDSAPASWLPPPPVVPRSLYVVPPPAVEAPPDSPEWPMAPEWLADEPEELEWGVGGLDAPGELERPGRMETWSESGAWPLPDEPEAPDELDAPVALEPPAAAPVDPPVLWTAESAWAAVDRLTAALLLTNLATGALPETPPRPQLTPEQEQQRTLLEALYRSQQRYLHYNADKPVIRGIVGGLRARLVLIRERIEALWAIEDAGLAWDVALTEAQQVLERERHTAEAAAAWLVAHDSPPAPPLDTPVWDGLRALVGDDAWPAWQTHPALADPWWRLNVVMEVAQAAQTTGDP